MKTMITGCAVSACLAAGPAQAQTFGDVQIVLGTYTASPDGGDKPMGLWFLTGPLEIGKPVESAFAWTGNTCDGWMVSSKPSIGDGYANAWRIQVVPVRVFNDAVTFRLRWVRFDALVKAAEQFSFDAKAPRAGHEQGDVELTLRPGESMPVDAVNIPRGARTVDGDPCGDTSIRVLVEPYPRDDSEQRLVGAELWLVERLANGGESTRSQPLAVRGLPNRPISFYFDRLTERNVTLEVYGTLKARLANGAASVALETRYRWQDRSAPPGAVGPQHSAKSDVQVKPSEIVEVQLPQLADDAGPFAKRKFSIRIRLRQLR